MSDSKSILIVAAEKGLGLGLARQFFARGWSVVGTSRSSSDDVSELRAVGQSDPERLTIGYIDVTEADAIPRFNEALGGHRFDVIYMNAGIYGPLHPVLNIHPGWVATDMGTLNGSVAAEIDVETSVRGVADVVETHMGSGEQLYLDYRDQPLAW